MKKLLLLAMAVVLVGCGERETTQEDIDGGMASLEKAMAGATPNAGPQFAPLVIKPELPKPVTDQKLLENLMEQARAKPQPIVNLPVGKRKIWTANDTEKRPLPSTSIHNYKNQKAEVIIRAFGKPDHVKKNVGLLGAAQPVWTYRYDNMKIETEETATGRGLAVRGTIVRRKFTKVEFELWPFGKRGYLVNYIKFPEQKFVPAN